MAQSRKPYSDYTDLNFQELFERISATPALNGKCQNMDASILEYVCVMPGLNTFRHSLGRVPSGGLIISQSVHPCKIEVDKNSLDKETFSLWTEFPVTARVWLI